ncbi:MAG: hypothetical protein C0625_04875 [Arcobacter sp.]|nr:MAG: hypothetical protein C0625_04875 [Arcobacter sp.]
MHYDKYEWNEEKNKLNRQKYGISFEEAKEVFDDALQISKLDKRFSYFEERWITVGSTTRHKVLVVANLFFTDEGEEIIRIISARKANNKKEKVMKSVEERAKFDNFELEDNYDFTNGVRGRFYKPKKVPTSMRLDNDILLF